MCFEWGWLILAMLKIRGSEGEHSPYSTAKRKRKFFSVSKVELLPSPISSFLVSQVGLHHEGHHWQKGPPVPAVPMPSTTPPIGSAAPELPLRRWFLFCGILHSLLGLFLTHMQNSSFQRGSGRDFLVLPTPSREDGQYLPTIVFFPLCPQFMKPKRLCHLLSFSIKALVPEGRIQVKTGRRLQTARRLIGQCGNRGRKQIP